MKSLDKSTTKITKIRQQKSPHFFFEMNLTDLRKAVRKTQDDVAQNARISQPKISAFEQRSGHNIGALRRYIEALGGRLEITAVFDENQRVILKNI
jgi:transcriptional regulator with XRE-family HTH domain